LVARELVEALEVVSPLVRQGLLRARELVEALEVVSLLVRARLLGPLGQALEQGEGLLGLLEGVAFVGAELLRVLQEPAGSLGEVLGLVAARAELSEEEEGAFARAQVFSAGVAGGQFFEASCSAVVACQQSAHPTGFYQKLYIIGPKL
jgi:hypothetical protein